jgi:hypothetical protein
LRRRFLPDVARCARRVSNCARVPVAALPGDGWIARSGPNCCAAERREIRYRSAEKMAQI